MVLAEVTEVDWWGRGVVLCLLDSSVELDWQMVRGDRTGWTRVKTWCATQVGVKGKVLSVCSTSTNVL